MKRHIIILLILAAVLPAQDFSKVGTTGFVFLNIPVSARYVGLGETGITLPDAGAEGLSMNPALASLSEKTLSAQLTYASWYVETTHQAAGVTYNRPGLGTIGLQVIYFDFGEMAKTRNPFPTEGGSFVDLGTFSASAYSIGLTYSRRLTDLFSFGGTVKYVNETIDTYSADNVVVDIGFLYFTRFHSLRIGAYLQHFGLEAKYLEEKFKMPQMLKLGASAEVWGERGEDTYLTVIAEAAHPNDISEYVQLGLEQVLWSRFVARAGYKFGLEDENLSLGGGLRFDFKGRNVRFDFGWMQHDYLDSTMRYTLMMEL